jgi:outer membrane protein assembly factor BamB
MKIHLCTLLVLAVMLLGMSHAAEITGWRTDGTGRYPQATPPKEWTTDKNVVWRTKMPGPSNSSPVPVGERLFVCSEPAVLLCVDRKDGKVLWQKENTFQDVSLTPEEQKGLEVERKQLEELGREQRLLDKEASVLRKKLADGIDKEKTRKELDELKKQTEALKQKRTALPLAMKFSKPQMNSVAGFSSCTPVTDGKSVYVAFGNGLAAAFDLKGNRRWIKLIEHPTVGYGHGATPLLVGDKLLVHYADLVGLDTKDGAEHWRTKMPPSHGTPISVKIDGTEVAITPGGAFVRVSDGKILANDLGSCGPNSPVIHEGNVYWIAGGARAVKLPTTLAEPRKVEVLWKSTCKGGDYFFASPVIHDGLIYVICGNRIFTVLDAKTGKLVYQERLNFGTGRVYPSIALAGDQLFVSADNGVTLILKPGREFKEVGRNTLEEFRSSPVFVGKRMYLRGYKHLYCIGE